MPIPTPFRFHFLPLCCLFLLPVFSVPAQTGEEPSLRRKEWDKIQDASAGSGPALRLKMPVSGKAFNSQAAFLGCTDPGATLTINGKPETVFPTGAFAGVLHLERGKNTFVFRASWKGVTTTKSVTIYGQNTYRSAAPSSLPATPLCILPNGVSEPNGAVELLPGDTVRVRFKGSPGARAWFQIGDRSDRIPMQELPQIDGEVEYAGLYEGTYTALATDQFQQAPIHLFLQEPVDPTPQRQPETVEALANGSLTTVWQPVTQSYVEVKEDETPLFKHNWGARRLNYVDARTRLEVVGRQGDKYRIRLGKSKSAWIPTSHVRLLGTPDLPASLRNPRDKGAAARIAGIALTGDPRFEGGALLTLDLQQTDPPAGKTGAASTAPRPYDRPLPLLVEAPHGQNTVTFTLWDLQGPEFTVDPKNRKTTGSLAEQLEKQVTGNPLIEKITCTRPDNLTVVFTFTLKCREAWGFQIRSESAGRIQLALRPPPKLSTNPAKPLQGIKVLLSPGHGGMDSGAIGATGLTESDANLAVTLLLQKRLKAAGAEVETLREGDIYVSLDKHAEAIAKSNADLLVSIHANSISEDGDPSQARGPLTFFSYDPQEEFAATLYEGLPRIARRPPSGKPVAQRDLRVTRRAPHMPATLVETLFISNPEDEMLLLDPAFLDRLADSIYKGIVYYLKSQLSAASNLTRPAPYRIMTNKRAVPMKEVIPEEKRVPSLPDAL